MTRLTLSTLIFSAYLHLCFAGPDDACSTQPESCKEQGAEVHDGVSLLQHSARKVAAMPSVAVDKHPVARVARAEFSAHAAASPDDRGSFFPALPPKGDLNTVGGAAPSCSPLVDHGAYFGVKIGVGTPSQPFDVVLDTGSNNVLAPWCGCHGCSKHDPCFTVQESTTFTVANPPPVAEEGFGSGIIDSVIASDFVKVGGSSVYMDKSLFLVLEMDLDKASGKIDGILGLGKATSAGFDTVPSFMDESGLDRFSVCMHDKGSGALRLGSAAGPEPSTQLGSVGVNHWALGLTGVGVSGSSDNVPICTQASILPGNVTACSAIPDSGTTDILGPPKDLIVLFGSLCNQWSRCKESAQNTGMSKHHAFITLLLHCNDWIREGKGIHELPAIEFKVAGSEGTADTVSIGPEHYTFSTHMPDTGLLRQNLKGVIPEALKSHALSEDTLVCAPSFSGVELDSETHGAIWVLGLPLFYSNEVQFSTSGKGSISFSSGSCHSCDDAPSTDARNHVQSVDNGRSPFPRFREGVPRAFKMKAATSL